MILKQFSSFNLARKTQTEYRELHVVNRQTEVTLAVC